MMKHAWMLLLGPGLVVMGITAVIIVERLLR